MDEGDVAKFTDAIKEFDSMTRLVCSGTAPMFFLFKLLVGLLSKYIMACCPSVTSCFQIVFICK